MKQDTTRTELSKTQQRALKLAAARGGIVDTLRISGATGHSLYKLGLFFRHVDPGEFEGTNVTYELTAAGKQWLAENCR